MNIYSCIEINRTSTVHYSFAVRDTCSLLPRKLVRPLNHLVEDGPKIAKARRAGSEPKDRAHRANGKERRGIRPVGSVDQKERIMRLIEETANSIAVATSVGEPKAVASFPPGPVRMTPVPARARTWSVSWPRGRGAQPKRWLRRTMRNLEISLWAFVNAGVIRGC